MLWDEYRQEMDTAGPTPAQMDRLLHAVQKKEEIPMKHPKTLLRPALAAAALCAALAVTALAAGCLAGGFRSVEQLPSGIRWNVDDRQMELLTLDSLPQEAQALAREAIDDRGVKSLTFDSWAQATEFFGVTLPQNSVLDAQGRVDAHLYFDTQVFVNISLIGVSQDPETGVSLIGEVILPVQCGGDAGARFDVSLSHYDEEGYTSTLEEYTTPGGFSVQLVHLRPEDPSGLCRTKAVFLLDGTLYILTAGSGEENGRSAALTAVLDSFE